MTNVSEARAGFIVDERAEREAVTFNDDVGFD